MVLSVYICVKKSKVALFSRELDFLKIWHGIKHPFRFLSCLLYSEPFCSLWAPQGVLRYINLGLMTGIGENEAKFLDPQGECH